MNGYESEMVTVYSKEPLTEDEKEDIREIMQVEEPELRLREVFSNFTSLATHCTLNRQVLYLDGLTFDDYASGIVTVIKKAY